MFKTLLDTDIFSDILKGMDNRVRIVSAAYIQEFRFYTLSMITVIELIKGFPKATKWD